MAIHENHACMWFLEQHRVSSTWMQHHYSVIYIVSHKYNNNYIHSVCFAELQYIHCFALLGDAKIYWVGCQIIINSQLTIIGERGA